MSAGGINRTVPLGAQPTSVGAGSGDPGLAPVTAGAPIAAPALFSAPAATTATAFVPQAGAQAGNVAASGGLVPDGLPRTAAFAAGVGGQAYTAQAQAQAAANTVAGQQVVDPASVQPNAAGAVAPRGPAAWDESWAKRFKDAGAPAEITQQLTFTGAMGADTAQLEQMLAQIKGEVDTQLAKFAHDHPEEFKKLRGNPDVDRGMLAQIAAGVNAGQVPKEQLEQLVDSIGKSQGKMIFDTFVKPMLVYSLIPGWGALRLGFAPFTGGKDPLTGEKMFGDKMATAFTVMTAVGGGITLFNHARGAMQVAQGMKLASTGGDAAMIAAREFGKGEAAALAAAKEGFGNLSFGQKFLGFVPGTQANKMFSGLSRFNSNLTDGVSALKAGSIERELAENVLNKWRAGELSILGDPASKWTKMGFQPNARGMLLGRTKAMMQATANGNKPAILLDGRMTGKTIAAHLASQGVDFADDALKARLLGEAGHVGKIDAGALKMLRERTLGNATTQLLDAKFISRPGGLSKVMGAIRPGPMQDALWAADNVGAGTLGKLHGTAAIPKFAKWGLGGLAAAGAGYYMIVKAPADAAKKAAEEAAKQQAAAQAAGGGQAAGGVQMTPELQSALQQFAALPSQQQAQVIQQQYAQLQQASQQPNLTAEQTAQIKASAAELELFMQVAQGGAPGAGGAAGGAAMGGGAPQGAQPAAGAGAPAAAAGAGAGGFTAKGLGLG